MKEMSSSISDARKIEIFRTMARAWHEQDWETCASLFAPDGILHSVMLEPVVGRQTIYDRISRLGGKHKSVTLNIERIGVIDGAVVVQRVDEIVIDGRRGECPAVGVIEFEGDRIARWRDYYDRNMLAGAAGHGSTEARQ
jgi:limonene-1,2-epoxide hydrolase